MSTPTPAEQQELIDTLFEKLDDADQPGKMNQLTHALRMQISAKRAAGRTLDGRERAIIAAVGTIGPRSTGAGVGTWLIVLGTLSAIGFAAWKYL